MTNRGTLRGLSLAAFLLAAVIPRWAAAQLTDPKNTCTTPNCSAQTIVGAYRLDQSGRAIPFQVEIFSQGGECVRVEVTKQVTDLDITLVSPQGNFWRDDDGGSGLKPLLKAITSVPGWYILQISSFNAGGSTGNFTAKYGRYNSGNPNCNQPDDEHGPTQIPPKFQ